MLLRPCPVPLLLSCRALAEAVKAAAVSFKPKPTLKVPDIDDLPEVPKNLHKVRGWVC